MKRKVGTRRQTRKRNTRRRQRRYRTKRGGMEGYQYVRENRMGQVTDESSTFDTLSALLDDLNDRRLADSTLRDSIRETIERSGEYEHYMPDGSKYIIKRTGS